jgi:hypothetical protein
MHYVPTARERQPVISNQPTCAMQAPEAPPPAIPSVGGLLPTQRTPTRQRRRGGKRVVADIAKLSVSREAYCTRTRPGAPDLAASFLASVRQLWG